MVYGVDYFMKVVCGRWTFDLTDVGLRNVLEVVASHVRSKGCHLEEVQKEIKNARGDC